MALWVCDTCTTRFAVGLHCCPGCTSTLCHPDHEETPGPKITAAGYVSNAALDEAIDSGASTYVAPVEFTEPADGPQDAPGDVTPADVTPVDAPVEPETPAEPAPEPVKAPSGAKKASTTRK